MDKQSPALRDLARRLLALEAVGPSASDPQVGDAMRMSEKLRISLTRVAGSDGYDALLRRALALASAEIPSLRSDKLSYDGRPEGFEQLAAHSGAEAAVAITTHLLGLLVTFIGEPIMLRMVREAWPDSSLDELHY